MALPHFLSRLFTRDASSIPVQTLPVRDALTGSNQYGGLSPVVNLATGIGGADDPTNATFFQMVRLLTRLQVETAVMSCGEARRLCYAIPEDMVTAGWTITDETDDPEPMSAQVKALNIASLIRDAACMANQYGEAYLMPIVWEDGLPPDEDRMWTPLNPRRITRIERFQLVLGALAREVTVVERQNSLSGTIQTGDPTIYRVMMARTSSTIGPVDVHASRLIRFTGDSVSPKMQLPTGFYLPGEAISVLQGCLYALIGWIESASSTRRAQQEVSQKVLRTYKVPAEDAPLDYVNAFASRWAAFRLGSSLGTTVLDAGDGGSDKGEELSRLNFPVAGLAELDEVQLTHLAAAKGWPKERLAGLQPTGVLNSGPSWESSWWSIVEQEREQKYRRPIEQVYRVLYGAAGMDDVVWSLAFNDLGQPSPKEAAEIAKIEADTLAVYVDMGAVSASQVRRSKFGPEAIPPAGIQPATPEEMSEELAPSPLPLAVRSDPVARAQAASDAAAGVCVALEVDSASVAVLRAAVGRILPDLDPEQWLHVTLVYLGDVPARDLPPIRSRVDALSDGWPTEIEPDYIGALGDDAIVLRLRGRNLDGRQSRLLRSLAPKIRAEQHPRFVAHMTLGRLARELTGGERARLDALSLPVVRVSQLVLRAGQREVASWGL